MKIYQAQIRQTGDPNPLEVGECTQAQFTNWIKRGEWFSRNLDGAEIRVKFTPKPHTFLVKAGEDPRLMTPNTEIAELPPPVVDPALEAQFSGS